MLRIEYPKGTWTNLTLLLPYTNNLKLDESLDHATVQCLSSQNIVYPPLTKVQLIDGSKTFDYIVQNCSSAMIGYQTYQLTFELIEPTEMLKGIPLDNISVTQPIEPDELHPRIMLDEVIDRLLQITPVKQLGEINETLYALFELDTNIRSLFETIESPEFLFHEYTLFDALVDIGMFLDMFPRVKFGNYETNGKLMITFDELDIKTKTNYTVTGANVVEMQQPLENYANKVISNVANLSADTIVVYPGEGLGVYVNAPEGESEITDDNAIITLPYPIKKIIKIEAFSYIAGEIPWRDEPKVYEYSEWLTLDPASITVINPNPIGKKKYSIYYRHNTNTIHNIGGYTYGIRFFNDPRFDWVHTRNTFFRITYIPYLNAKMAESNDAEHSYMVLYNQNSNIVEQTVFSKHLKNYIKRMEQGDLVLAKTYYSLSDIPQLGHQVNNEYIVTNISYVKNHHTYDVTIQLSKNYTRRAEFIRAKNEVRTWEIPADGRIEERNILLDEKMHFALSPSKLTNIPKQNHVDISLVGSRFAPTILDFITYNGDDFNDAMIVGLRFMTRDGSIYYGMLPAVSFSDANQFSVLISTMSNTLLGLEKSLDWADYVKTQIGVTYTDEYGNFETLDMGICYHTEFVDMTLSEFARNFPLATQTQVDDLIDYSDIKFSNLNIQKDAREKISITYTLRNEFHDILLNEAIINKYRGKLKANNLTIKLYFFDQELQPTTKLTTELLDDLFPYAVREFDTSIAIGPNYIKYTFTPLQETYLTSLKTIAFVVEETKEITAVIIGTNIIDDLKDNLRNGELRIYFK